MRLTCGRIRTENLRTLTTNVFLMQKRTADERLIDDIDDPNAYSIEDAKLKAEHDKMIRDAEAKKLMERKRINTLRKTFLELLQKNSELPSHVQLKREVGCRKKCIFIVFLSVV